MTGQMLLLCLSFYQTEVDKPSIRLFQDNFIVRVGEKRAEVPLQLPKTKPKLSLSFRKNKNYAVWDDRGLTIRIGKEAKSTKLDAISTSPKVFTREELLSNVELIKQKKRFKGATALSGAMRIGGKVYFLARWEDSDGKAWLEVLVSVDLEKPTFHPTFLAKLPGTTLATQPIDERLFILTGTMTCVVRQEKSWGVASFTESTGNFDFKPIGEGLESYDVMTPKQGAFVEKTSYGSRIGGRVDLTTLTRKNLVETKGSLKFADTIQPLVALTNKGGDVRLINTDTGAELDLLSSVSMRRTPLGLVVWSPFQSPKRAWLYDMNRWTPLAEWTAD